MECEGLVLFEKKIAYVMDTKVQTLQKNEVYQIRRTLPLSLTNRNEWFG